MRIATFTGAINRVKIALRGMLQLGQSPREMAMPKPEKPRHPKPPARLIKLRTATGSGIRGPAFIPSREFHHVSRQTCRAALRGLAFAAVSKQYPNFSRRTRRAVARIEAKMEYLRMMADPTNAIPDEEARAAVAGQ
jgi:hypothetical protein